MASTTNLTIHEAATATGWSPRMLRYVEQLGLVEPTRSSSGYRLYGPGQLQRLSSLRALLETHSVELGDVGFALRLRRDQELASALGGWFDEIPTTPETFELPDLPAADERWLAFEQDKHQHLLNL